MGSLTCFGVLMNIKINDKIYDLSEIKEIWRGERLPFIINTLDIVLDSDETISVDVDSTNIGFYFTLVYVAHLGCAENQTEFGIGPITKDNIAEVYFFNSSGFNRVEKRSKLNLPWAKWYEKSAV